MQQPLSGAAAFLEQAHRNNWQRYLASLPSGAAAAPAWDLCLLTVADEQHAALYSRQLQSRRESGLLPAATEFVILPDPPGQRPGSGGATLHALAHAADRPGSRILVLHSGSRSRRLPHAILSGRLFARVPRTLPDGRASTIFDELLLALIGLVEAAPPGALIAAGDVLPVFDPLQISLQRAGVTGMSLSASPQLARNHGVYVTEPGRPRVISYLLRASATQLRSWDAIGPDGTIQIDSGLVWLDANAAAAWTDLAAEPAIGQTGGLHLYRDLLAPLATSTTPEDHLTGEPALEAARAAIRERLRGIPFSAEQLRPAVLMRFGSPREFWRMTAGDPTLAELCGWTSEAASWCPGSSEPAAVHINTLRGEAAGADSIPRSALLTDCALPGPITCLGAALIAHVETALPVQLAPDLALDQLPLAGGLKVTRLYGLDDDPDLPISHPAATFLNRPWADWLAAAAVHPEAIWPDLPPSERTLWNARLYPATRDGDQSLQLVLPMQDPARAPHDWRTPWLAADRRSMEDVSRQGDGGRLLDAVTDLEDRIAAHKFVDAVISARPAAEARRLLPASSPGSGDRLARRARLSERLLAAEEPIVQMRGLAALAVAVNDERRDDRAFELLRRMIAAATAKPSARVQAISLAESTGVRVTAPARIDFGGGWTDTPPRSIECGGTVLNAAVTLDGAHPVAAEAIWLPELRLVLESRDLDAVQVPATVGELLAYSNPADPFALHKASLALYGLTPAAVDPATPVAELLRPLGRGLRLTTMSNVPRGSGLGTSSVLAGVVLACLRVLFGSEPPDWRQADAWPGLFDDVLCVEQMMTTGGGWQDQVGGLTSGIKLVTTMPGLPQRIDVSPLILSPATADALRQRLLLVYTGQQRLAKNLLRQVMRRWMLRDPEMGWILDEIGRLALEMHAALGAGDLDAFGALMGEHWALNKRMHTGCTNPFIDNLFERMAPYINGGKLAGAGGGGFAIVLARDARAADDLSTLLEAQYPGAQVTVWPGVIAGAGLTVSRFTLNHPAGAGG